ncbi:hypothetical protein F5B22DRAFT_415157 [Xylaria bambusicola]|uniref:uncharacterized protein n=1 Tax=Xylaria bambusicola TaxID=326684 RepID=UPI002007B6F9|nr:uncharacterized protein F5B22DRAFT_415157 [Xylaria bambusicola]KAI0523743.1 hypothetical protein F5B22DRAFT_415157 [Xylaria bambusicola]
MKYFAVLTTLLLGATASPVGKRQTTIATISEFFASTIVNDDGASIGFHFAIKDEVSTRCHYSDKTSDAKLPDVPFTKCDDGTVRWQFRQDPSRPGAEGRYRLVIVYTPASSAVSESGFHEWNPDLFKLELMGTRNETHYTGYTGWDQDLL